MDARNDGRRFYRDPYWLGAVALGAVVWVGFALATGLALWHERGQAIARAQGSAEAVTALMQAHTARTFQNVELTLQEVAETLDTGARPLNDASLRRVMRERLKLMPYVRASYVIGPDGRIEQDTDYPGTPDVSLADRAYFQAHVADPELRRAVSAPILSRSGTGWFVAVTQRIGSTAEFKGIAVAAIQLGYFADLYRNLGLNDGHLIMLFHRDGQLLAQYPPDDARIGQFFNDVTLFRDRLPRQPKGTFITDGPLLPYERIVSYQTVERAPLVVVLTHNMTSVLASWRNTAIGAAIGLAGLLALITLVVTQWARQHARDRETRDRLVQGEKLEALGRLTGSIAHDFGNVLGVLGNAVEMLRRLSTPDDPRTAKALEVARRAIDNGAALTRNLLSFSRERKLDIQPTALKGAVEALLPLLRDAAGSFVAVDFEPGDGLPLCPCDKTQFDVALLNLVINAKDAMDDATGRIMLTTYACSYQLAVGRPAVRAVCLSVTDSGAGMSDEVRRRALEPFFTTKAEKGNGFGLPQVYGFMKQLGGDLQIESAPGQGSTIRLIFPEHPAAPAAT